MAPSPDKDGKSALPPDEDIPDDISLNSSISSQHTLDREYDVERVLAEKRSEEDPSVREFLIQWTGYKERDWTWEPERNLNQECIEEWEEVKEKQRRGELTPFNIGRWEYLCQKADEEKVERHRRRNIRRKREGLPLNLYEGEAESDYYMSDEDVNGDDFNEIFPPPKVFEDTTQSPRHEPETVSHQPSVGQGSAAGAHKKPAGEETKPKPGVSERPSSSYDKRHPSGAERPKSTGSVHDTSKTKTTLGKSKPPLGTKVPAASKSAVTTGYQGTARKVSTKTISASGPGASGAGTSTPRPIPRGPKKAAPQSGQPAKDKALKPKKAKKTTQKQGVTTVQTSSGNVFISGKKTRARPKLGDIMGNKEREAKHFQTFRVARKAELRSRDMADKAPPDPSKIGLFNISTGVASASGQSSAAGITTSPTAAQSAAEGTKQLDKAPRSAPRKTQSTSAADPSETHGDDVRKKSRSVRFSGDASTSKDQESTTIHYLEDVPMVDEPEPYDEELFVPERPPILPRGSPPPRFSRLEQSHLSSSQNIGKTVVLGPPGSRTVDVTFEGLPKDSSARWMSRFNSATTIVFGHVCMARAFASQCEGNGLRETTLACGSVTSLAHGHALESAAEQLRLGSFGLVHVHEEFCMIIYPARCEDWKTCIPEVAPAGPAQASLKYTIFKAKLGAAQPVAIPSGLDPIKSTKTMLTRVMREMLGFDYERLIPLPLRQKGGRHNFFLAFPESKGKIFNMICSWLRDANPNCRIFISQAAGDWHAFMGLVKSECGIVIIHDAALRTIRLFPKIRNLLLNNNTHYSFFSLQESFNHELVPSPSPSLSRDVPMVGFQRLFPHGNAVLVTPSFLLTQPRRARQLFSWYRHHLNRQNLKIVLSEGVVELLEDLAHEKALERTALLKRQAFWPPANAESQLRPKGLSEEDCIARFEVHSIVRDLHDSGQGLRGYEGQEPFVLVDGCIHANDEQSLVNWFGWWSLMNLHQYRKFHVLGSHDDDIQRSVCRVPLPHFVDGSTGDPSAALAKTESRQMDVATQPAASSEQGTNTQSKILTRFNATTVYQYLLQLESQVPPMLKVFRQPVSWFGDAVEMADIFGDIRMEYESYNHWFAYLYPFNDPRNRSINTYLGFFYTIDSEWDAEKLSDGPLPARHPWIAVYRAHLPWIKPVRNTELLIWDPMAAERVPGPGEPQKSRLMPAQRALVDFIERRGPEKNPDLDLQQVWYGGYDQPVPGPSYVIDRTLEMVEMFSSDPKSHLPGNDKHLYQSGFKKLLPDNVPNPPAATNRSLGPDAMDIDPPEPRAHGKTASTRDGGQQQDIKQHVVFHAPRGFGASNDARSSCRNSFFDRAIQTKAMNSTAREMDYKYVSTAQWYMRQKGEGRHYEHVNVDSWEPIFKVLRVQPEGEEQG